MGLTSGETVLVPCGHCASISLPLTIQAGTHEVGCSKCGHRTRVRIEPKGDDWRIIREGTEDTSGEEPE